MKFILLQLLLFLFFFFISNCSDPSVSETPDFLNSHSNKYFLQSHLDPSEHLPATRVHHLEKSNEYLVSIDSVDELRFLARSAHGSSLPGIACGRLVKIGSDYSLNASIDKSKKDFQGILPSWLVSEEIKDIVNKVKLTELERSIETLEALGTRDAYGDNAKASSDKVKEMFLVAIAGDPRFVVETVNHNADNSDQESIIVRLEGDRDETMILGAHLDSINSENHDHDAPGADDNATGIATLLEMVRIISHEKLSFERSIEWHAYAVEEYGLIGSQAVVDQYVNANKTMTAMLQTDMTGYDPDNTGLIYLIENDTDPVLQLDLRNLISGYLEGKFSKASLNFGTSDHKSFHTKGYAAAFAFENPDQHNPSIHSTDDKLENIKNSHLMRPMAQLAFLFAMHHAGLKTKESYTKAQERLFDSTERSLKIGIQKQAAGTYDFYVASEQPFQRVELCSVREEMIFSCRTGKTLHTSTQEYRLHERTFFIFESLNLAANESYGLFGFESEKALPKAFRAIALEKL